MIWLALTVFVLTVGGGISYVCWAAYRRRKGRRVPGESRRGTKGGLAVCGALTVALMVGFGAAIVSPKEGLGLWGRENGHLAYMLILAAASMLVEILLRSFGDKCIETK